MRRDIPGTTFHPRPCSRSACTRLAAVASSFLPLRCLSWHRQRSFPDPGTVSQLGTSSLPSSSCPFTRRPPRSISRRCKSGLDGLLPALRGPSVARRAHADCRGAPAYRTWPRPHCSAPPLPLCVCARGSGVPSRPVRHLLSAGSTPSPLHLPVPLPEAFTCFLL